jgi:hypothetical protein
MNTNKNTFIYPFLKKLKLSLESFTQTQHYNILFYMKDDIVSRDKAINLNNGLIQNFNSLLVKYYQYLENIETQKFIEVTTDELNSYSDAVNELNNSLERINFKSIENVDNMFHKFKAIVIDEIRENIKNHTYFMKLVHIKDD